MGATMNRVKKDMTTNNFFMQRNIYACKLTKNRELSKWMKGGLLLAR